MTEIDGGQDYFGKWDNSFPTDPDFFPIGVWAETFGYDDADTRAMIDDYQTLGINTFVGSYGNPAALDYYVKSKAMYFVGLGGPTATASNDTTDEPDLFPCEHYVDNWGWPDEVPCENTWSNAVSPESLQGWADLVRAEDPTRPAYGQFTRTQTVDLDPWGCVAWGIDEDMARAYAATSDILSFDYYVLVNTWIPDACRHFQFQGKAVEGMRRVSDYEKPVWFFVETSQTDEGWDQLPDLEAVEADVWSGLVAGARGLQWFNHCFCGDGSTSRALRDSRYTDVRAKVNVINHEVQALAPVLNADFVEGYVTASGDVDIMAKYYDGDVYLFAVPNRDDSPHTARFTVPDLNGATLEVVGEGRTITADGDSFTDSFDVYEHHIYRWTP